MQSSLSRLNAITALATSVILCLIALIDFTAYPSHRLTGTVDVRSLQVVSARAAWNLDRAVQDYLELKFDIDADFTPLFTWNTKQVFVSLVAEYDSKTHTKNQIVIWDKILRTNKDSHILLNDIPNKYGLKEVSKTFKSIQDVRFVLKWNVMPKVGLLHFGDEFNTDSIQIPTKLVHNTDGTPIKPKLLYY